MVGKLVGGIVAFFMLASCGAKGAEHKFMPENTLYLEDCIECEAVGGITEAQFNQVAALVQKQFTPIFTKMGETFVVERAWKESDVNAWAMRQGKKATVHLMGGLARRREMGIEGFMLVASHEVGHLISHKFRKPVIFVDTYNKMSIENISDVVGQEVFMRNLIEKTTLVATYFTSDDKCGDRFTLAKDLKTCNAQLAGGQQVTNLFATMDGEIPPDYNHLDRTMVNKTNMTYASTACRLTSYYYGAMRKPDFPTCWYKP